MKKGRRLPHYTEGAIEKGEEREGGSRKSAMGVYLLFYG